MFHARSGIALVMVLLLLMILITLISQFSYTVKVDAYAAQNSGVDLQLRYALLSAVNHAIAQLQLDAKKQPDSKSYDCELDEWAKPLWTKKKPGKIGDVLVDYYIVDENTKFNLTMLPKKEYPAIKKEENKESTENNEENTENKDKEKNKDKDKEKEKPKPITPAQHFDRLIDSLQKENKIIEAAKLREAILAWIKEKKGKPDNATGPFPTKIPILSIKELSLIKGINNQFVFGIPGLNKGFQDIFTVWSDGKININTASVEMIQSLNDKITLDIAQSIVDYRKQTGIDGELQTFQTISDIKKVEAIGKGNEKIYSEIENIITVQSSFFTIFATAKLGNTTKKMMVVVWRRGQKVFKLFCDYQ